MAVRYGTFRICELRTSHLQPYRSSVPYFNSIFEAYRTNVSYPYHYKKGVPYHRTDFLAKIEAYHTVLTYWTVLPFLLLTTRNFNWLWNHLAINQRSQFTHLTSALAVFCLCIQKAGAMCEKSGIFNSNHVPTYRTRTITKKAHRTNVPYPYHHKKSVPYLFAKIKAYRTVLPSLVLSIKIWKYKHSSIFS